MEFNTLAAVDRLCVRLLDASERPRGAETAGPACADLERAMAAIRGKTQVKLRNVGAAAAFLRVLGGAGDGQEAGQLVQQEEG